jgi:hypothetical protein
MIIRSILYRQQMPQPYCCFSSGSSCFYITGTTTTQQRCITKAFRIQQIMMKMMNPQYHMKSYRNRFYYSLLRHRSCIDQNKVVVHRLSFSSSSSSSSSMMEEQQQQVDTDTSSRIDTTGSNSSTTTMSSSTTSMDVKIKQQPILGTVSKDDVQKEEVKHKRLSEVIIYMYIYIYMKMCLLI